MCARIRPKKWLGQHFLKDETIAKSVCDSLNLPENGNVLEIGPGMGVLTKYLLKEFPELNVVEIDDESVTYLEKRFPELKNIIPKDFLSLNLCEMFDGRTSVIGNFPYNISSQILFHVLEFRQCVPQVVGMFQKEVALRITSPPGNRACGILSVLVQSFYKAEYLFEISEEVFDPPPKVKSAVIRLTRYRDRLSCDEKLFFKVVKTAFNQRRKKLSNALSSLISAYPGFEKFLDKRAEQLTCDDFEELTGILQRHLSRS